MRTDPYAHSLYGVRYLPWSQASAGGLGNTSPRDREGPLYKVLISHQVRKTSGRGICGLTPSLTPSRPSRQVSRSPWIPKKEGLGEITEHWWGWGGALEMSRPP